jgi:hypothetical protein
VRSGKVVSRGVEKLVREQGGIRISCEDKRLLHVAGQFLESLNGFLSSCVRAHGINCQIFLHIFNWCGEWIIGVRAPRP